MSASAQCPHSDIGLDVHITTMIDSNVGALRVKARCRICDKRMKLDRGLPMGCSSRHPTSASEDLGIIIPIIAEDEEPSKEWGIVVTTEIVA